MSNNDPLDRILQDHFEGPVPDEGFTDTVMQVLPARRRRQAWPAVFGIAIGGLLCWVSLLYAPLLRSGWSDWLSGEISAPALIVLAAMAGMSLLAMAWAASETGAR